MMTIRLEIIRVANVVYTNKMIAIQKLQMGKTVVLLVKEIDSIQRQLEA